MVQITTMATLLGASLVAGQSTINAIMFGAMPGAYEASIIKADKDATTMTIGCATKTDCGWVLAGATVTQGPSTLNIKGADVPKTEKNAISESFDCKLDDAKDQAKCSLQGFIVSDGQTSSENTKTTTDYKKSMIAVTVTAGADKLAGGAKATETGAAGGAKETGKAGDAGKAPTSAGKNAGPMVTGNAVLAGVAAAAVGALAF